MKVYINDDVVSLYCVCVYFSHAVGVQVDRIINESNGTVLYILVILMNE